MDARKFGFFIFNLFFYIYAGAGLQFKLIDLTEKFKFVTNVI